MPNQRSSKVAFIGAYIPKELMRQVRAKVRELNQEKKRLGEPFKRVTQVGLMRELLIIGLARAARAARARAERT